MKIVDVRSWVVHVPFKTSGRWSLGIHYGTTRTVVEVLTDEGVSGIGETPGALAKSIIDKNLKPVILSESPLNVQKVVAKCEIASPYTSLNAATNIPTTALEMACWDILGKVTDKPLSTLLGGSVRESIEHSGYAFPEKHGDLDSDGELAIKSLPRYHREMVDRYGFRTLELKVGVFSPDTEIQIIRAIREAVGDQVRLRIDSNQMWSLETALPTIKAMNLYKLSNVEEPVRGLEAMSKLKPLVGVHFSTHSSDVMTVARTAAADAIVGDLHDAGRFGGGIIAVKKLISAAESAGLDFWFHGSNDLGISQTAMSHVAAASPSLTLPHQATVIHMTDDIVKNWESIFRYHEGSVEVPEGPGLGVTLDMQKVDKYSQLYDDVSAKYNQAERFFGDMHEFDWLPIKR